MRLFFILFVFLLGGCVSVFGVDLCDFWGGFNCGVYKFNGVVGGVVVWLVVIVYCDVVYSEICDWVCNFFGNIGDVFIGVNNVLWGKFVGSMGGLVCVVVNSIFGLFGLYGVVFGMGIEKYNEDFG